MRKGPSILHVDMDAFFAAVEVVQNPALAGKPLVVGGIGRRGVVAAASYEARKYGIRSAMPSHQAQRLCPDLISLPGNYSLYEEVSRRVMKIFHDFTPLVEPLSLDEAFLDISGSKHLLGEAVDIAQQIRERVFESEHLTCSVGIAPNKFLAKLASDQAKPKILGTTKTTGQGICLVTEENLEDFLLPLPVEAIWGVGPQTKKRLMRLGVKSVGDLAKLPISTLTKSLGKAAGTQLWRLSRGIDTRVVVPDQKLKSVGHEETFALDKYKDEELNKELSRIVDAVASRLRKSEKLGRTITVKLRTPDFVTKSKSRTLPNATNTSAEILGAARDLLGEMDASKGVRLLGVSVSNLQDSEVRQLQLDEHEQSLWGKVDEAIDGIRERFGGDAIGPGSTFGSTGVRPKKKGSQQWGPQKND
ncbi:MAG: DNA polymerase IV [Acidimicrobiales bacterium AG-410-I20]|nr:MAG: DNA polymerase IV [Acidimicrobiales bacterium AG-410-I20]